MILLMGLDVWLVIILSFIFLAIVGITIRRGNFRDEAYATHDFSSSAYVSMSQEPPQKAENTATNKTDAKNEKTFSSDVKSNNGHVVFKHVQATNRRDALKKLQEFEPSLRAGDIYQTIFWGSVTDCFGRSFDREFVLFEEREAFLRSFPNHNVENMSKGIRSWKTLGIPPCRTELT